MRKGTEFAKEREFRHLHFATEYNPETLSQRFMRAPKPVCVYIGEDAESENPELHRRTCDYCKSNGIRIRIVHREELKDIEPWILWMLHRSYLMDKCNTNQLGSRSYNSRI